MTACFHCGEPIPAGVDLAARVGDASHAVCCHGCAAAAQWIAGLGLADYYRLRTEPAARPDEDAAFDAWDRPALQRMHVREHGGSEPGERRAEIVFVVDRLRCAACAWLIERALASLAGVAEVGVNAAARRVRLVFDPTVARLSDAMRLVARLGYAARPLEAAALDALRRDENRDALKRLIVAGLGTMQAMMYAVALYAGSFDGIDVATRDFFRWLGFLVATPVVAYGAQPFFRGSLREWRARRLSMDTPVAVAVALIYVASLVETIAGGREIYFDSVSMFVFFLLAARYVELRARHRAGDLVDALARLQPATAERIGDGGTETVGVHELVAGDRIRVAAGASVPADGTLASAACRVDESLVSGESTPRRRTTGDALIAGSLLLDGPVELIVRHVGADTVLAGIVRLVTRAATEKPHLARDADRRTRHFVVRVLVLTAATALAWLALDPSRAFDAALAVLVVSCPCAFALAVPTALTRAVAVLARRGVLVVDGDALEALARADVCVFDKTGTLTTPRIEPADVDAVRGDADRALGIAAALEHGSTHPLAQAFRAAAADLALPVASALRHVGGAGVEGVVDGTRYRLGHADFAGAADARDRLVLADDAGVVASFVVRERLRDDAADALAALAADGVALDIVSGDATNRVGDVARRLGIDNWTAQATPRDKLERIRALRGKGRIVAMVGDGINDAPVLAAADVAVALAGGAALAQAASGILLAGDRLDRLMPARRIAQQMRRTIRQNLTWSACYNLSVVPLAALGLIPPWLAAIGMSASSLVVVLNALRIGAEPAPRAADDIAQPVEAAS
ncbi:heavy metal translocating P-type ATPase [Tahibacter soli]|uniref:Heavy metal translocating P-type ATPase n=1 Tax=Tahibacter soli TaxID=2983605 RepID=A0A9X3YK10_9GAMM|nr:heavy metal translocating P-type ATPase [Tahibacter soli]MDC8012605.1 heavy metal translocating P-type ATPase [Tahibacter soli]